MLPHGSSWTGRELPAVPPDGTCIGGYDAAAGSGAQLPVLELVAAMYEQLLSEGDGELGTQALIKAYREG